MSRVLLVTLVLGAITGPQSGSAQGSDSTRVHAQTIPFPMYPTPDDNAAATDTLSDPARPTWIIGSCEDGWCRIRARDTGSARVLWAQESDVTPPVLPADVPLLSQPTYVGAVFGVGSHDIELSIHHELRVWPRIGGGTRWVKHREWAARGGKRLVFGWDFDFTFRRMQELRGQALQSSPILNPSIMWDWLPIPELYDLERTQQSARLLKYRLRLGHYSNGQSGCLFEGQASKIDTGEGETDCGWTVNSPEPDEPVINARDGSFSTNYVAVGVDYARYSLAQQPGRYSGDVTSAWGVGAEYKVLVGFLPDLLPGATDDELRDRYETSELAANAWWEPAGLLSDVPSGLFGDGPVRLGVEGFVRWGGGNMKNAAPTGA